MSKVCAKHRAEPVTIYRQCVGCEIEGQRVALQEWGDKTDWFRLGVAKGALSASYLGKHIADAMSEEIQRLRDIELSRALLKDELESERQTVEAMRAEIERLKARTIFVPCQQVIDVLSAARDELAGKPELLQAIDHILGSREAQQ